MQATVICALVYQKKASLKILSKIGLVIELYIYLCANVIKVNCCSATAFFLHNRGAGPQRYGMCGTGGGGGGGGAINGNHDEFGIRVKFSASYHFIHKNTTSFYRFSVGKI